MWQTALNTVGTAAFAAFVAFCVAALKAIGDAGVELINRKKDAVVAKIGADTYNHDLIVARSIWGAVDEEVRTDPELQKLASDVNARIEAKQNLFTLKMQKAIPGLTEDEIVQLRQAVAGEVNKGREALTAPTTQADTEQAAKAANDAAQIAANAAVPAVQTVK